MSLDQWTTSDYKNVIGNLFRIGSCCLLRLGEVGTPTAAGEDGSGGGDGGECP